MQRNCFYLIAILLCAAVLMVGSARAEETEILKITVGEPTFLSPLVYQNTASVAVSRTGTLAAFYPKPGTGNKFYRISKDEGLTWGPEMDYPPGNVGRMSVGLRDGGVLFMIGCADPVAGDSSGKLQTTRVVFSDDFLKYEASTSAVSIPQAALNKRWATFWPCFDKGKIVQLPDGSLLATLYGNFKGDAQYRTMICRSTDNGLSWKFHASVAYDPKDPDPGLVGAYCGYCEPSLALLSNGQLLCVMRTQGAELSAEYRPIYVSWSDNLGKAWTRPIPSKPHLMNISPTLAVLDNGVVACQYGRPGFHVAFSIDNGHTWRDLVSFSDLHEPITTGQYDMIKAGPNRLLAIGNDGEGVKVWPIDVERVKVGSARTTLTGCVLDEKGLPVTGAKVGLGPNRYTADSWLESEKLDHYGYQLIPVSPPVLGYRAISGEQGYPVAKTDARGRFEFKSVKLAEHVLTVEAKGYAPQWRHINVAADPKARSQEFQLKAGRKVRGRVVDSTGQPVAGACVVLNKWHIHADPKGFFHWSVEAPLPEQVQIRVYKRWHSQYETLKTTVPFSQIVRQPIILRRNP